MAFDPPIAVALDKPSVEEALALAETLRGVVPVVKVGLELFVRAGRPVVGELREMGFEVFLDLKFHDIPNTIGGAVRSATSLDVSLLTIHAAAGPDGMREARKAANATQGRRPLVVAVTVLTSHPQKEEGEDLGDEVERLAMEALLCGLDGVVCSPLEAARIRAAAGEGFFIVTPGIRPESADTNDQRRFATPAEAAAAGSDLMVIGRPITQAQDPRQAAIDIAASLLTGE